MVCRWEWRRQEFPSGSGILAGYGYNHGVENRRTSFCGEGAMAIHDRSRVSAGTFHDFHLAWIAAIRDALNNGILPPDYYAMAEQIAGPLGPDVLTLQSDGSDGADTAGGGSGLVVLATANRACVSRHRPRWMSTF